MANENLNKLSETLQRIPREGITSGSTGKTLLSPTAISAEGLLSPQTQINLPSPLQDTTRYPSIGSLIPPEQPQQSQQQQQQTDFIKNLMASLGEDSKPVNPLEGRMALEQQLGIDEKTSLANSLRNQLLGIETDVKTAQEELRGAGISKIEEQLKGNKIARDAAFRALPLSIQLDAAQGDLNAATSKLNTYFQIH